MVVEKEWRRGSYEKSTGGTLVPLLKGGRKPVVRLCWTYRIIKIVSSLELVLISKNPLIRGI